MSGEKLVFLFLLIFQSPSSIFLGRELYYPYDIFNV